MKLDVNEFFNDHIDLKILLKYLHDDLKIKLCIISFGNEENIKYIVNKVFGDIFDDVIGVGITIPCWFGFDAKNKYLKKLMRKHKITSNEILFFDDLDDNIKCAEKINVNLYQNPITGITPNILLKEINNTNLKNQIMIREGDKYIDYWMTKYIKYKFKYLSLLKKMKK